MEHPSASKAEPPATPHSLSSRVDIGHFDPEGVLALKETLSRQSRDQVELSRATTRTATDTTLGDANGFDFEKTLRNKILSLRDSGVQTRELGVMFQDLRVIGLGATVKYQTTFGSLFDPHSLVGLLDNLRHPPVRDILSGFSGVVRPGEMLLVLGRPGSGCSTLLKTLANQRKEYHAVEGEVHYDSFSPTEITNHYRGDVIYCPEDDIHFPTLSVHNTLRFAAKTRTPRSRPVGESREQYVEELTDILETLFGLRHARNTPVGDNRIRGVSGGEKKRVSIAEALATRHQVGSWDNSTRGLDASTALEFVRALRIATDVARLSTSVSIYQAGEQLYELFDKVCVIYEGKMAYFGPANKARQYFIDMGYEPAYRQTTSDFLVAVTDPAGRIPRAGVTVPAPVTATEFAAYFQQSEFGDANRQDIKDYRATFVGQTARATEYMASARSERAKRARQGSPYTISIPQQASAVMVRSVQILKGNPAEVIIGTLSFIFQAIIVGTVFVQLPESTSAYFGRGGALFFCVLFPALTTLAEVPTRFAQRPIIDRHQKSAMYHPFIEAVSLTLIDIPIMLFTVISFCIPMYFIVRLQHSASQFFIFLLFVFISTFVMKSWFRFLASAFKSPPPAITVAGLTTLIAVLYTGYTIPRTSMIGALRWLTHVNPLRYTFASIIVNEFHTLTGRCAELVPSGPGYESVSIVNQVCSILTAKTGQSTVNGMDFIEGAFGYHYSELWRNFGILCAFAGGFCCFFFLFSEYNTTLSGASVVAIFARGTKAPIEDAARPATSTDAEKAQIADREAAQARAKEQGVATTALHSKMEDVFSWHHLDYSVTVTGGQQRRLLNDISGYVLPGKLTALMGESGAGKTTLLNVLAERQTSGVVTGDRHVNGQALPTDFQAQTGYVQQMDTHLETTTVREALLFSAKMRQPLSVPIAEKEAYVEECLKMCGLESHADAIVGSLGVEHRKRTTIGVELAAKPKLLLFLDEPTSGLDSQSAWAIMDFLRTLADSGTAILCTIHQPSAELFMRFDRLLLLKKGGQTVYFGDLGENANTLINYLEGNGGRTIADIENPAEYMLEVIGAGATANSDIEWSSTWQNSKEAEQLQRDIERIHTEGKSRPAIVAAQKSQFATPWVYQTATLLRRNFQSYWRTPSYLLSKLAFNSFAGLIIGFTFWQAKDTQQGTQNKLFTYYLVTLLSVPMSNQLHLPWLHIRSIYEVRERSSRTYSWTALVASQILVELPWNFIGSTLFFFCSFWTVGLDNSRAAFTYLLFGVIFPLYITTIGQAVAAMSPSVEISGILSSSVFSFVIIFNGVMQPFAQMPGGWKWMYWVTPFHYLINALVGQVIGHQQINCSPKEIVTLVPPGGLSCGEYLAGYISRKGGYLLDAASTSACQFCSTRTTDEFLSARFHIKYSEHWWYMGLFIGYIGVNVVLIFALTWLFRIRTGSLFGFVTRRLRK